MSCSMVCEGKLINFEFHRNFFYSFYVPCKKMISTCMISTLRIKKSIAKASSIRWLNKVPYETMPCPYVYSPYVVFMPAIQRAVNLLWFTTRWKKYRYLRLWGQIICENIFIWNINKYTSKSEFSSLCCVLSVKINLFEIKKKINF